MINVNKYICTDALSGIKTLPNKSIDFILTDPPYCISNYGELFKGAQRKSNNMMKSGLTEKYKYCDLVLADWDLKPVDMSIFKEMYRVLKPGGSLLCFYDMWKMGELRQTLLDAKFHQFRLCEWVKNNPTPINSKRNYLSNAKEYFIYCVKGWKATFNSKYDNGIYTYPTCSVTERQHPTQKPLKLINDLILKHTKENDTVLDCYAGSGTTAVACKTNNRNFVCFDISEEYCVNANERINKVCQTAEILH